MSPQVLTASALRAWLQLAHAPGLAPAVLQALLDACGSPDALLRASVQAITAATSPAVAQAVRASERGDLDARTDAVLAWLDAPGNAEALWAAVAFELWAKRFLDARAVQ